jgi:hypothetical protein
MGKILVAANGQTAGHEAWRQSDTANVKKEQGALLLSNALSYFDGFKVTKGAN